MNVTKNVLLGRSIMNLYIHLFKFRWNEHLVNYFPLMYRYVINTNIFI